MTRVNTIPPKDLLDQHLFPEWREIKMIGPALRRTINSKAGLNLSSVPKEYTLNSGHVKFFYPRGLFLYKRYQQLTEELIRRGYAIDLNRSIDWSMFDSSCWNDWEPDAKAHKVNCERIKLRYLEKPDWYRYCGKPIQNYISVLNQYLV